MRYQAERPVNPASVMKLVTTYAAMDMLGPDFTWGTDFYTDGTVSGGTLRGNLYVRGGGDPKLVLERIQDTFRALQAKGVTVILGDMVLDHSAFDLPDHDAAEFDGESLRPYNASPDGLLVNFKSVVLTFQPDPSAGVAHVISEPPDGAAVDRQHRAAVARRLRRLAWRVARPLRRRQRHPLCRQLFGALRRKGLAGGLPRPGQLRRARLRRPVARQRRRHHRPGAQRPDATGHEADATKPARCRSRTSFPTSTTGATT